MKIDTDDYTLKYDDSEVARDRVFKMLLDWFKETEMFNGESLCQSDQTYIDAPGLLADIAEKGFKFKVTWKE